MSLDKLWKLVFMESDASFLLLVLTAGISQKIVACSAKKQTSLEPVRGKPDYCYWILEWRCFHLSKRARINVTIKNNCSIRFENTSSLTSSALKQQKNFSKWRNEKLFIWIDKVVILHLCFEWLENSELLLNRNIRFSPQSSRCFLEHLWSFNFVTDFAPKIMSTFYKTLRPITVKLLKGALPTSMDQ